MTITLSFLLFSNMEWPSIWTEAEQKQHEFVMKFGDMSPTIQNKAVQAGPKEETLSPEFARPSSFRTRSVVQCKKGVKLTPMIEQKQMDTVIRAPPKGSPGSRSRPPITSACNPPPPPIEDTRWKRSDGRMRFEVVGFSVIERQPKGWLYRWFLKCFN